jgi:hypothetical protein
MESVNDIHRERVNFLTVSLFRLSGAASTRAPRRTRLASTSVMRFLVGDALRRGLAIALVGAAAIAIALALLRSSPASAELENSVYTSKLDQLRIVVPRGWRATDQPSYPGLLLWMMRSEPEGRIVLTSEPFTRDVYCSWPVRCQMSHDSLPAKVACALGSKLAVQSHVHVGPVQAGPKENEDAGLPSVWFEYDDGHSFMRQALAIDGDHVVSLVLSASTAEARNAHVRAFEQALRTLRPLTAEELGAITGSAAPGSAGPRTPAGSAAPAGSASGSTGSATPPSSAGSAGSATIAPPVDAGVLVDAPPPGAGSAMFSSAPAPRLDPIGPCPRR